MWRIHDLVDEDLMLKVGYMVVFKVSYTLESHRGVAVQNIIIVQLLILQI